MPSPPCRHTLAGTLGRAIVRQPKVFPFDGPLSNLAAKMRAQTRTELKHRFRSAKAHVFDPVTAVRVV